MIEVPVSVEIARPPEEVFDFLSNMENNPRWQKGMKKCTWTSEGPTAIGSTYRQEAAFLGRPIISDFEVYEYEAGRRISIRTTASTMPLDITRSVEATSGGTRVSATIRGAPTGFFKLFGPLMKIMVRSSVTKDYQELKSQLEAADVTKS